MDSLSLTLYSEIDITCICMLIYIAAKSFGHIERRESWHFFQLAIYFILLFVLSDLVWYWMENGILPQPRLAAYGVNWIYFLSCIVGIASWFFYTEYELEPRLVKKGSFLFVASIPLILILVVLILNVRTHCLFYLDQDCVYHRGPLNILGFLIPCIYLGASVLHSLAMASRKENYTNRQRYLNLACFSLPAVFPAVLQIFIPGTPLSCIGLTASVLIVYMTSQELLVSIDPLTKLNNRHHMIRYLSHVMEHHDRNNQLFLLLLDLDKFKHINDTYGHIEGDHALIRFAAVLEQASFSYNCFVSRYGGDEFIIVLETPDPKDLDRLCRFIHGELAKSNRKAKKEYLLSVSIGWAKYTEDIRYVPEFIHLADQSLYEAKLKRPR
ncbi:MAG: GGDEF domain-containing protein [Eubacteriales bacterium]|nr:GGDEF domain-containing protein [Eubacteriales bacterium]